MTTVPASAAHHPAAGPGARHGIDGPPVPPDAWYVAARSEALSCAPLARTILGSAVVLFRGLQGAVWALEDRCPHKNVALSLGRVRDGHLECRYHGWWFDGQGALLDVPCRSPDERLPQCRVPAWRAVERDGWIWVSRGAAASDGNGPPAHPRDPRMFWFDLEYVVEAPLDLVLENGLDCSHTGFAHEGLFRSAPTQFVTTRLDETPTGVRATIEGEQASGSGDTRARLGRGRTMRHVDEVVAPHTLLVAYEIGPHRLVTILVCTPERPQRTRVYNRNGVSYGRWTPLIGRYVRAVARRVVRQDVEILNSQAARIREHGRREFRHVVADQAAVWMERVLAGRGGRTDGREIVYRL